MELWGRKWRKAMLFQDGRSGFWGLPFFPLHLLIIVILFFPHVPHLLLFLLSLRMTSPITTTSLPLIKKTDMWYTRLPHQHFTSRTFSTHVRQLCYDHFDWHMKRPIISHQQTIIHIIHPIIIQGPQFMMAPANHEVDMMGALGRQSGVAMWRNRGRMFEHVVNRPEM